MFAKATLTIEDLCRDLNTGESTIWAMVSPKSPSFNPDFPQPLQGRLGRWRIWLAADVETYLLGLRSTRTPPPQQ